MVDFFQAGCYNWEGLVTEEDRVEAEETGKYFGLNTTEMESRIMEIVVNGIAKASVVLPENPTKPEQFAAEELISYVTQITGVELEQSDRLENKIYLNQKEFGLGAEGCGIKVEKNAVFLSGADGNPLYAVYEFLERFCGCALVCFSGSGVNAGEYVPKSESLIVEEGEFVKKSADLPYRTAIMQYDAWAGNPNHALNEKFFSWLAKNRYNRILTWVSIYEGFKKNGVLEMAEKRGIKFSIGHHEATNLFMPTDGNEYFSEKYYETHPEFYRLKADGTRHKNEEGAFNGQLILCMRNEEGIREFAKNVIAWIDQNENVDIITLWPGDGVDENCCCEKCRNYNKSDNYTYFTNKVAKMVHQVKPNVKIDRIVYNDLIECGEEELCPSLLIDEAVWLKGKLRNIGAADGSGFIGSEAEQIILKWKEKGAKVVYYDYLMGNYGAKQRFMPAGDEMHAVCNHFMKVGIDGLGTQIEPYNHWNNIINFYTYGRTAYNASLTLEQNLDLFCRIFGEGAHYVKELLLYCEALLDGRYEIKSASRKMMEAMEKEKVYSLYEQALAAATTARARNNIRMMRMAFRYTDLEVSGIREEDETIATISESEDPTGEMWYLYEHFDSFKSGKEGYGIAFPVKKKCEVSFRPNLWYQFE